MAQELIFRNQTICVELIKIYINNSQITKAHNYLYNYNSNNYISLYKWIIIIISMLVGISEAIRLILLSSNNYYYYLVLISHNIKYNIFNIYNNIRYNSNLSYNNDKYFNEWLGGLIDGNGYFKLTKKGYVSLDIIMDIKDKSVLYHIIHKYGGSIKLKSGGNSYRYRLHNKIGLINLINGVNGNIRNPIRMLQLNKLCNKYNISFINPLPLTYNNGWLSGYIDSNGSIDFNEQNQQLYINIIQKNRYILEPLINIYGGKINIDNTKGEAFKYIIYRKQEILNLKDNYFNKYPLKSIKNNRLLLVNNYYELIQYKDINKCILENHIKWLNFREKWINYKK